MHSSRVIATLATLLLAVLEVNGQQPEYAQCGGVGYTGSTTCVSPYVCTYSNAYYSQCLPGSGGGSGGGTTTVAAPSAVQTIIPSSAFNSQTDLLNYFDYNYPWGDTHNGAARMIPTTDHVVASGGTLTLTSVPYVGDSSSSITYHSGTVYAKSTFTVGSGGITGYDFTAKFKVDTAKGCWPAFWLTGVSSWPPEIDIAEWKGTNNIWFNTFNTSSSVASSLPAWPNDGAYHTVLAQVREESDGRDISIKFYLDGALKATQYGSGFIGAGLWLIIDYQMLGSSGSPGPTGTTYYYIQDIEVLAYS